MMLKRKMWLTFRGLGCRRWVLLLAELWWKCGFYLPWADLLARELDRLGYTNLQVRAALQAAKTDAPNKADLEGLQRRQALDDR